MFKSAMLEAIEITKTVNTQEGNLNILEPISFLVERGESLAITGASGSGKSTLLGILAGLDVPTSGRTFLNNKDLTALDEEGRAKVRAENIGFIFQSFQLLPGSTALQNVMLPLELNGNKQARTMARDYLDKVGLGKRLNHYPKQLSGGEQQRVAIARAFASQPRILFADEPTGNLDAKTGSHITELMFKLNQQQGTTLILVTHEKKLAELCNRHIELCSGRILTETENQPLQSQSQSQTQVQKELAHACS